MIIKSYLIQNAFQKLTKNSNLVRKIIHHIPSKTIHCISIDKNEWETSLNIFCFLSKDGRIVNGPQKWHTIMNL